MNLNQASKKAAIQAAKKEALKQMTEMVQNGLSLQMELVMLMVLHDKFGFGAQRCGKALEAFETLWGDVNEKRLSLEDIAEVVKDEIGLWVQEEEMRIVPKGGKR